jgi:hypothetical protein
MVYFESTTVYENSTIDKETIDELNEQESNLDECYDYVDLLKDFISNGQFLRASQFVDKSVEKILEDFDENRDYIFNLICAIQDFDSELAKRAVHFFGDKITPNLYDSYKELASLSLDFLEDKELSLNYFEKYYINSQYIFEKYDLYLTLKDDLSDTKLFGNVKKDIQICFEIKENSDYIISTEREKNSEATNELIESMRIFESEKDRTKLKEIIDNISVTLKNGADVNTLNKFEKTPLVVMIMSDSNYYKDESIYLTKMLISAGYDLKNENEGSNIFNANEAWGISETWLYDFIDSYKK